MTGFKVKWNCSNCHANDTLDNNKNYHSHKQENRYYRKLANLLQTGIPTDLVWKVLKRTKLELIWDIEENQSWNIKMYRMLGLAYERLNMYEYFFGTLLLKLNISSAFDYDSNEEEISDDTLETAAKMFIYMTAPQQEYWTEIFSQYSNWLEHLSPRRILGMIIYKMKIFITRRGLWPQAAFWVLCLFCNMQIIVFSEIYPQQAQRAGGIKVCQVDYVHLEANLGNN